jgi:hypothetical protein
MRFIGDVHGKFKQYKRLIKEVPESIQVGDLGVGFFSEHGIPAQNPPYDTMVSNNSRFIRGNHDNPTVCKKHSQWIPDGYVKNNMFFLGGARSIDAAFRIEHLSWWRDEELSYPELQTLIDVYKQIKPEIMITHDIPKYVVRDLFSAEQKLDFPSITRDALQIMWEEHKPKLWIFGHWHFSRDVEISDCRFICLNELEHKDIEV